MSISATGQHPNPWLESRVDLIRQPSTTRFSATWPVPTTHRLLKFGDSGAGPNIVFGAIRGECKPLSIH
jgi:hypothetical protein